LCYRHYYLVALSIGIALPRYPHPWLFSITPLGIGIPSFLVSASPLSQYQHPALSAPPSSVSVSLALGHCRYQASVSLSCLRTPSPNSASASSSTGFVSLPPPYNQYHHYSYTPTNLLIETHKHSLWNRALYSYTALSWPQLLPVATHRQACQRAAPHPPRMTRTTPCTTHPQHIVLDPSPQQCDMLFSGSLTRTGRPRFRNCGSSRPCFPAFSRPHHVVAGVTPSSQNAKYFRNCRRLMCQNTLPHRHCGIKLPPS
jgi:hypothetical protein